MEEHSLVILDQGSATIKAGLGTDTKPSLVWPSLHCSTETGDLLVGSEAGNRRNDLALMPIFERGSIVQWPVFERLWGAVFSKLNVDPAKSSLCLIDSGTAPLSQRKKLVELIFEKYQFCSSMLASTPIVSAYCSGQDTALILECGHSFSQVVPIHQGYCISPGILRSMIAGSEVGKLLLQKLSLKHLIHHRNVGEIVREIKEKYCYLAMNGEAKETQVELPDGAKLVLNAELTESSELLFDPSKFQLESEGLAQMCLKSIQLCDLDTRFDLYKNILLTGGTTLLSGFVERLQHELTKHLPSNITVSVLDTLDKLHSRQAFIKPTPPPIVSGLRISRLKIR